MLRHKDSSSSVSRKKKTDSIQFDLFKVGPSNADALPGLGTAILRTPQPRQTLACLSRRDPRRVSPLRPESNTFVYHLLCGRAEGIQFSARRQYWPYISRSFVGLTPGSSLVTSLRQLRANSRVVGGGYRHVLVLSLVQKRLLLKVLSP
ncbi:hypothetical protein PROFUN_09266 [Planoprotostelium fungivorum]|uniref:Uncharacterized protein n=1 Tax=Planoprotostelium fungivorum TaxID=1890364 RepID=A0A2P6NKW2_9EUKA|nr:hypothetical protein PROFUN_09266 [Planoprotostelium fungivorum]